MATRKQRSKSQVQQVARVDLNQSAVEEHTYSKKRHIAFEPKTETQRDFVEAIRNNEMSVGIGPAGVGKTFCAATIAAQMLVNNEVEKIILTRANVTVGETIGMLPGTIEEKMTPLLLPILTALKRQLGDGMYEYCLRKKKIEMLPAEYIRGLSFLDAFVIIDEAQNLTKKEVMAVVTRYESGRVVFLGDPDQHDLENNEPGIEWLDKFVKKHKINIPSVKFELSDIVRHPLVKKFLYAIASESKKPSRKKAETKSTLLNG